MIGIKYTTSDHITLDAIEAPLVHSLIKAIVPRINQIMANSPPPFIDHKVANANNEVFIM